MNRLPMKTESRQQFIFPGHEAIVEIRTTLNSTSPYAEHFHSSFSLGLILEGQTRFFLGKETYLAEAGDIVLIAPEQVHSCNPVAGKTRSYHMAHIDAAWLHNHVGTLVYGQPTTLCISAPLIKDAELFAAARNLFDAVCAESAVPGQELAELLAAMHARGQCFAPAANAVGHSSLALAENPAAEGIIEGNYSISALARAAGIRRESFSRSIHRTKGLPPSRYLHCLRLEHGRRLLQEGRSVAEAAMASGYVDQSHFHRMFVKYYSTTPGSYRKNLSHPYKK